jgi:hypothetical protein
MQDQIINIAGLPVTLSADASGFYATATFQNVTIDASPLVIHLDPPVATVTEVNAPALLLGLLAALANGAVIG